MIDLYTWTTPNGRKVSILLEELGVPYTVHAVDIGSGAQKTPEFLAIGPNNKIPVIVDRDTGLSLMESGAIMIYLADKYGRFLPSETSARMKVIEWLMWQMGGFGPMLGQGHQYLHFNPGKAPFAEERFTAEIARLYGVLDRQLEGKEFICAEYSIADMACWPWVSRHEWQNVDLADFPNVRRWYRALAERPAVRKGYHVPKVMGEIPPG